MSFQAAHVNRRPTIVLKLLTTAATLKATILTWRQRRRSRKELARMSERDRRDLGYSSCDVAAEAAKPFWNP
jgi:uncharacterized protein YjiS (DUF1127 family)